MAEPIVTATTYTVSVLPLDHIDAFSFAITVEYRGRDLWAVCRRGRWCLAVDGEWEFEPTPSGRDEDWLGRHRFGLDAALRLAREAAPNVQANGVSAAEVAGGVL